MGKKILIGRIDVADFPDLALENIDVKIDSGAFTSSFHCHDIEVFEQEGQAKLRCKFLDPEHPKYHDKEFIFTEFEFKNVKSSNGVIEGRYAVNTVIRIFNKKFPIELTLTERESMKYPVLLGRKFLSKKFVVDVSRTNLSQKNKIKKI